MNATNMHIMDTKWNGKAQSSNLPEAWKKFLQHVQLMFDGIFVDKYEVIQCKYLLLWVSDEGRDVLTHGPYSRPRKQTF